MRKQLNQHLFSPLSWLLILVVVLLLVLVLLFLTPLGPRTVAQIASSSIKELSLEGVSGSLFSGVHVEKFIWDDGSSIVLDKVDVKLNTYNLKTGKLSADQLKVGRLSINLEASESDSTEVVIPDFGLPLSLDARLVRLGSLQINKKHKPANSEKIDLTLLFKIDDLQLEKLKIEDNQLHFERLQGNPIILDAPLKINVTDGHLNMNQPHDLNTSGTISFKHKDLGEAAGNINLDGTLTHYEFNSNLDIRQLQLGSHKLFLKGQGDYKQVNFDSVKLKGGDGTVTGKAKVAWDPDIKWSFKGQGKSIQTKRWMPDWPATLNTNFNYQGSYLSRSNNSSNNNKSEKILRHEVDIINLKGNLLGYDLSAKGQLNIEEDLIKSDGLKIQLGNNKLAVSGKVGNQLDMELKVEANELKQLLAKSELNIAGQVRGSVFLKGTFDKPSIKLDLKGSRLAYQDFKQGSEALSLVGDLILENVDSKKPLIKLNNLAVKVGNNRFQLSGDVNQPLNLKWKLDAKNLKQISPDLGGNIVGEGVVLGSYQSPIIKAKVAASALRFKDQVFAKKSIKVEGQIQLKEGQAVVKNLVLNSGNNRINISGKASSPYDLKWDVDGKDLKQLMPDLSGSLYAKGGLKGTIDKPIINATIKANNLRYQDITVRAGDFVAKTNEGRYSINGKIDKLVVAGQNIKKAKLRASGRIENHKVDLSFKRDQSNINLTASGGWRKQQWSGTLQQLSYKDKKAGNWRLQNPVKITATKEKVTTSRFCLNRENKTITCSKLSWNEKSGIATEGKLIKTPLALLKPWLPDGMELNGNAEGSYSVKQYNGRPKGTLKITLPDNSFSIKGQDGEKQTFSYQGVKFTAKIDDKTINTNATMVIVDRGTFSSKAVIKLSPKNGKHTIDGSAQFDVPNINWAQPFIPHSRGLRGVFTSKFSFTGLLNKPKIIGRASLKNAYLRLPEAGTELTNINLNLHADRPGMAKIDGKMLMGKGVLSVSGDVDARNPLKWKANVNISGKNIRFMNTNEIKATMTPNLTIALTPNVISFKGKVLIPEAAINLKKIPELSIDESEDAIVLGEQKPGERVSAIKIQPNVLVELGDKIKLNAFGLQAKLSGKVNITHNRRDILAQGSLKVFDGKYQAYGQNLDINNGRLIFNGSPKLVGMNIRATRTVDDNLVGVHLGGTILKPKSKIFSEPSLPDSEALSLLLTGHTLSSASGKESAVLMSAVRGLGITGSDSLLNKIGSSFGLDDVNIVTKEDFRKSELALGKRLGSRLYVRYIVGLFDQAQKIAIDYKINRFLSLQAETSAENYGLDFIYKIERD